MLLVSLALRRLAQRSLLWPRPQVSRPPLCARRLCGNELDDSAQQAVRAAAGSHESDDFSGYKGGRVELPFLDGQ